jgi:hypothetical protein
MLNFMKSRTAGRNLVFTFIALLNCGLLAQTPDPYKFFPSSVGNVWEYSNGLRTEILRDSIAQDSSLYLWVPNYEVPLYMLDKNFNVFWDPVGGIFGPGANWLHFKLDADSGDYWIVDIHHIIDTFYVYKLAIVDSIFEGLFYDYFTTFKSVTYYQYQPDSIINQYSMPENIITLAYGIGEVMNINVEGGAPVILLGCIIDGDTIGIITSVEDEINSVNSFQLFQNYPNPFNPITTIKFSLAEPQQVKLIVYSLLGEEIKVLVDEYKSIGIHSVIFDAGQLASGIYIYTLVAGNKTSSKKLILLK